MNPTRVDASKENVYELVYYMRMGSKDATRMLIRKYEKDFHMITGMRIREAIRTPYLAMYEDDLFLEALLSLEQAVNSYRRDGGANLDSYIRLVANRRVASTIRLLKRRSGRIHNEALSLDDVPNGSFNEYDTRLEMIPQTNMLAEPEYHYHYESARARLDDCIDHLSEKEKKVCACWQEGLSYQEAARRLNITTKAYDGRLQRVRKKLETAITQSQS